MNCLQRTAENLIAGFPKSGRSHDFSVALNSEMAISDSNRRLLTELGMFVAVPIKRTLTDPSSNRVTVITFRGSPLASRPKDSSPSDSRHHLRLMLVQR